MQRFLGGGTQTRTSIYNLIHQLLRFQPMVQAPKQAQNDTITSLVGFPQAFEEGGLAHE